MRVLGAAGTTSSPFRLVADVDWPSYLPARPAAFFAGVAAQGPLAPADLPPLLEHLATADPAERENLVLATLRSQAAGVLGHSEQSIDEAASLIELGFSSFTALELAGRVRAATGVEVPATVVFDHPTLVQLARHVSDLLAAGPAASTRHAPGEPVTAEVVAP
ncbi:acyl carrier protein [Frankia sp. AiPa1]|nr:acyl carrier protein [Frankia sp. AiPa1]